MMTKNLIFQKFSYYSLSLFSIIQVAKTTLFERNNSNFLDIHPWAFQELLINYQGGFVRRGFIGNLIYLFDNDGVLFDTLYIFVFINFLIFVFLINLNLKISNLSNLQKLLFHISIFAPFSITLFGDYYARKEIFIINFYLALLFLYKKKKVKLLVLSIFFVGLISLLIHEGITFFLLFPFLIHLLKKINISNRVSSLFKISMIFTFAVIVLFKGNMQVVSKIYESMSPEDLNLINSAGYSSTAIDAIGWGILDTLKTTYVLFFSGSLVYWSVFFMFILFTTSIIINSKIYDVYLSLKELIMNNKEFLLILPLFTLGYDWGRWIFTIFYLYFFLLITDKDFQLEKIKFNLNIAAYLFVSLLTEMPACCIQQGGTAVTSNYYRIFKSIEITIMNFLN